MCAVIFGLLVIVVCATSQVEDEPINCDTLIDHSNTTQGSISPVMEKHEVALLQLVGFGGVSLLLAMIYNSIRKYVFDDVDNLDTTFDAGGKVSASLTAVTVMSQLLRPGDLLQSTTIAAKNGIGGTLWYLAGALVNITLFPILSQQFKIRAPGAKTFLQLIHARFGNKAHMLFVFLSLLTNLVVTVVLLVAAIATFKSLTNDASPEFCVLLVATLFGSYSFVGGLGTTFYVSYFNSALIFVILIILIINIFYIDQGVELGVLGSFDSIYEQLSCLEAPEGNEERSYLTFSSEGALIWFVLGLFASTALIFCDQATWQSRIAAKPVQGVLGHFVGTYMWFTAISVCSSTGLAYLALSSSSSSFTLPSSDIDAVLCLVMPFIVEKTLGYVGGVMVLTMLTMALMSTGSGEVMAVSSIIVYDIYQIHINPFRKDHTPLMCLMCGKKTRDSEDGYHSRHQDVALCACLPAVECPECETDQKKNIDQKKTVHQKMFSCQYHGQFRRYQESLIQFKSWCILWVTLALVPLGLAIDVSGIDLTWIYMAGFTITTPCFPGAMLTIMWVKTSKKGIIIRALAGLAAGLTAILSLASTYEGGLRNFLVNTSKHYSAIAGTACSFSVLLIVTVAVSLFTHKITDKIAASTEWQKLRDIDNPLHPWKTFPDYKEPDLQLKN